MKKKILFLLLFNSLLFIGQAKAQKNTIFLPQGRFFIPHKLQLPILPFSFAIKNNLLNSHSSYSKNTLYRFDSAVHYSAFFCKMELTIFEKSNVWLKFHAGDYDRYTKGNLPVSN
ncbi:MAG: hypothetical protein ACXVPU_07690 [Bacteroidia bacterium]